MKIGQQVVCVDDRHQDPTTPCVVEGKTYTIRGFSPLTGGLYLVGLELDYIRPGLERAFLRSRFREVDDLFSEKVLENVLEKIKEEELECV